MLSKRVPSYFRCSMDFFAITTKLSNKNLFLYCLFMFFVFDQPRVSLEEFRLLQPALDAREQSRQTQVLTLSCGLVHPCAALLKLKEEIMEVSYLQ